MEDLPRFEGTVHSEDEAEEQVDAADEENDNKSEEEMEKQQVQSKRTKKIKVKGFGDQNKGESCIC